MGKAEDTKARHERAALTLFVARTVAETTTKEIAMAASVALATTSSRIFLVTRTTSNRSTRPGCARARAAASAPRPATRAASACSRWSG